MLPGKTKSNINDILIFKVLIDSINSRDERVSVNNVLREYNEI